ncbi:MAG: tRNA uridine-5-carboxymethylaminomethyl(34) synthesis GTPase MnmE [Bacteroidaceae bacterium]|nr:tRNA uridine-5-carboxymethylaminomethyl(34) synthesis GTPase MnmE [Bacteroidaceae bacterium]MBR4778577.1 tRNA uridine-5-carboxymethylaminomethyl(34) synthesis GTPase MnmE [Bacteroidaceae bacterium]
MNDTVCALATPAGGALGIIRVSGPEAISIADKLFRPVKGKPLTEAKPYTVHFGQIVIDGRLIDEVLATVFRAPHSYTGEDSVEFSCHGSPYILQCVLEALVDNGCTLAKPGEYTQRAFLNGKMDLSQAEAVADLIASQTAATHRIALQQMRGGYSQKLNSLRNKLLEMASLLELELDFSEEDVEFAERRQLAGLMEEIKQEITRLTSSFRLGNALKNGVPVAIIGAPNVGKSTLLNRFLREDRAIVSDIQGTTRDAIEDTMTLQGVLFRFIDTAGIRHTDDTIEKLGIERSIRAAEKAQIILLITEPGVPYPDISIRADQTVIRIVNKTETFQALTGKGTDELERQLLASVPSAETDELLVTNIRHYEALTLALGDISRAFTSLQDGLPGDLIAEDLRLCLAHLGEILGEITSAEILANIFSHFCIGK